jgi:hypothetical protein
MAAAVAATCIAALPSSGAWAATVTQTASFSHFNQLLDIKAVDIRDVSYNRTSHLFTTLSFAGFDTTLGALTGASLALTSLTNYGGGVAVIGLGTASLKAEQFSQYVTVAGSAVGAAKGHVMSRGQACGSGHVGCFDSVNEQDGYAFDSALVDLVALSGPSGVEVGFDSTFVLDGFHESIVGSRSFLGLLDWSGGVTLTYVYDPITSPPGGVPEPAVWAMLVAGFGAIGAMARTRRRAMAS